jgi:predicted kinase
MKNHELNNLLIELDEINVQLKPLFDKYINGKNKLIRVNAEQSLKMLIRRTEILINNNQEAYNIQVGRFRGDNYRITEYLNDFYLLTVFPTRFPEFLQLLNAYNNSN